jgi:hypothetical protein
VWTDIGRIAAGLLGWLIFGAAWLVMSDRAAPGAPAPLVLHLAAVVFAAIGLIGLRGVLGVIGYRSREYRRSRGGRQSVELVIAASCVTWLAALSGDLTHAAWFPGAWRYDVRTIATVVQWMSMLMVIIGVAYLLMNAWWIRRALRRPPPHMDQVLMPALPKDTWIPDREE